MVRALQGAGAGAFEVAVLTAVAATVPADLTGRAVSAVYTGQIAGTAIGPMLGGLAGERQMDLLFLGAAVAAAVAAVPVLLLLRPDGRASAGGDALTPWATRIPRAPPRLPRRGRARVTPRSDRGRSGRAAAGGGGERAVGRNLRDLLEPPAG
ncbi:MFS transporter [Parafrankia sp. CH37]|uniref:MFS transporter n=1 Tax=Parafrankia sp. CH37 TaxID=683308 RepID=UPI00289C0973|nr:MFS transporter [Parafrankia sp. CH37]